MNQTAKNLNVSSGTTEDFFGRSRRFLRSWDDGGDTVCRAARCEGDVLTVLTANPFFSLTLRARSLANRS